MEEIIETVEYRIGYERGKAGLDYFGICSVNPYADENYYRGWLEGSAEHGIKSHRRSSVCYCNE